LQKERETERETPPQKRTKKGKQNKRKSNIPILFEKMSSFCMQLFQNENKKLMVMGLFDWPIIQK
jgi:hypothetical protein